MAFRSMRAILESRSIFKMGLWVFLHLIGFVFISQCSSKENISLSVKPLRIPVEVSQTPQFSLNLEGAFELTSLGTNLVFSVSGCSSGYTMGARSISSGQISLYNSDINCLIKLNGFTFGSTTYSNTGGTDFTTWLPNDTAVFKDVSSSSIIYVRVQNQVTQTGVQSTDTVIYKFTDLSQGPSVTLPSISSQTPVPIIIQGSAAPNFTLVQARYLSTNSNGSANLSFTFQCGSSLTGSSNSTYACSSVLLNSQLDYMLVPDIYSQGVISVADANTAYASKAPTSVNSLIVAPNGVDLHSNSVPNGGFYTSDTTPLVTGTTPIYPNNLNYVIFLRSKDASGNTLAYLYFYIYIIAISQTGTLVSGCGTTFDGGAGTPGNPYLISTVTSLSHIPLCTLSSYYFLLTKNLDLGGSLTPWNPGVLYGQFNGNNYTLSNMYINNTTAAATPGLFTNIAAGASVSNLNLALINMRTANIAGGLSGQSSGAITNVTTSGIMISVAVSGGDVRVGGLVGINNSGTISNSSSTITFSLNPGAASTFYYKRIGGLIGVHGGGSITNSHFSGSITSTLGATSNAHMGFGGLIGWVASGPLTISNSYSTGNQTHSIYNSVPRDFGVGGILGMVNPNSAIAINLTQVAAYGTYVVNGVSTDKISLGGLVGLSLLPSGASLNITNSYTMVSLSLPGTPSGTSFVAGALGRNSGPNNSVVFTKVYSAAPSVSGAGATVISGFVALGNAVSITSSYLYQNANVPAQTYTGLTSYTTTTQMETESNFVGFDFNVTPVWRMPSANPLSPNSLLSPVLNWQCGTNGIACY